MYQLYNFLKYVLELKIKKIQNFSPLGLGT